MDLVRYDSKPLPAAATVATTAAAAATTVFQPYIRHFHRRYCRHGDCFRACASSSQCAKHFPHCKRDWAPVPQWLKRHPCRAVIPLPFARFQTVPSPSLRNTATHYCNFRRYETTTHDRLIRPHLMRNRLPALQLLRLLFSPIAGNHCSASLQVLQPRCNAVVAIS